MERLNKYLAHAGVGSRRHCDDLIQRGHVAVDGHVVRELGTHNDLQKLLEGVWLSDGYVKAKRIKRLKAQGESTWLEIVLSEGKNREVRRMLAKLEHKVMRLKRTRLGPLDLDRLPKGKSRRLK